MGFLMLFFVVLLTVAAAILAMVGACLACAYIGDNWGEGWALLILICVLSLSLSLAVYPDIDFEKLKTEQGE